MYKLAISISLALALAACGGSSNSEPVVTVPPPATPAPTPEPFAAVSAAAQQELQANVNSPAVSVAIYHQGEVVYAEAFGNKRLGSSEPAGKDTLFQLGSVTKMFTALATLQMVDQGMVQLHQPLVQALPGMAYSDWQSQSWQAITLHDLLANQSGLYDDYAPDTVDRPLLEAMRDRHGLEMPLMNPPGKFYNYSNPNFSYSGAIVEAQSQTDYRKWMQNQVFAPLGMHNTTMLQDQVASNGDFALGVRMEGNDVYAAQTLSDIPTHIAGTPSGSYTWSTASDLVKMAEFLFNDGQDLLDPALKASLTAKQVKIDSSTHYGYGIEVADGFTLDGQYYQEEIWYHGGSTQAYRAFFVMLPEQEIAVAVLNSGPDEFGLTIARALKAVAELPQPQAIPNPVMDSTSLDNHVGTYIDYANELTFEVSSDGSNLSLRVPEFDAIGQTYSHTLQLMGDGIYRARSQNQDFYFSFVPEQDGGESVYMKSREAVGIKQGYESW